MTEKYLSAIEIAREAKVSHTTVYNWIKRGLLEPDAKVGDRILFSEATWEALKHSRSRKENASFSRLKVA